MALAKVGKRGTLVIPSKERKRAETQEGDYVEITKRNWANPDKKAPSLKEIQKMARNSLNGTNLKEKLAKL